MSYTPLKPHDPITLADGEITSVMVAGKNSFTVRGHVSAYSMRDEGVTWKRGHVDAWKEGLK